MSVIFIDGGYALSRSQNDKSSNIWQLISATTTFMQNLVVEWRRLSRFPDKITMGHAYKHKSRGRGRPRL